MAFRPRPTSTPSGSATGSFAFTSAPRAISIRTASALPLLAHVMTGVSPVAIGVLGLAPAFRSSSTSGALPLVHACDSGVMRKSFAAFASAPARISRSAATTSFQCAAHRSAVEPSSARAFDVGVLVQQRTDLLLVLVPGRLDQPEIAVCRGGTRHHQQHHQRTRRPHRSCCIRRACRSLCGWYPRRLPLKMRPAEFIACVGQNSYESIVSLQRCRGRGVVARRCRRSHDPRRRRTAPARRLLGTGRNLLPRRLLGLDVQTKRSAPDIAARAAANGVLRLDFAALWSETSHATASSGGD